MSRGQRYHPLRRESSRVFATRVARWPRSHQAKGHYIHKSVRRIRNRSSLDHSPRRDTTNRRSSPSSPSRRGRRRRSADATNRDRDDCNGDRYGDGAPRSNSICCPASFVGDPAFADQTGPCFSDHFATNFRCAGCHRVSSGHFSLPLLVGEVAPSDVRSAAALGPVHDLAEILPNEQRHLPDRL